MKRISDKVEKLLNLQIQKELTNALLYEAISNWANYTGLVGVSKLYKKHYEEELGHKRKFVEYLLDRDAMPIIPSKTFDEIPNDFKDLEDVITLTLKREIDTTESIKKIKYAATEDNDCNTTDFLISMIVEQTEEEANAQGWIDRLEVYKSTNSPLILLDNEMGS